MVTFNNGEKVEFSLYGAIEGQVEFSGEVLAVVAPDLAAMYPSSNVVENHVNIWPLLPEETRATYPNSHTAYDALVLKQDNGSVAYIGLPWIRENIVVRQNPRTAELVLDGFVDTDSNRLTKILAMYGYSVSSFKINN